MAFSILDFLDQLEKSNESGKYQCPACGGNDFTVNKNTGGYNCWHDISPAHRADILDALAPMTRWEKPPREPGRYDFVYKDNNGKEVVIVHRDDTSGSKKIWQDFPTVEKNASGHRAQLQEVKAKVMPYQYEEAIAKSDETGLPIFIVEGENACQSVWALGIPCVTFLGGSKQYRTNGDYSHLFKNHQVVLCPDRDQQGVAFMTEVATDNPGAQWLYADPRSWEWNNLPPGNGYDVGDYIEEGAEKDDLLASVGASRHKGRDGKPSYDEIISTIEGFVGLYANDSRINYETSFWLEQRSVKMSQQNIEKMIDEAKLRVHGKEEIESVDALTIASSDKARDWLIAGIVPLGSVTLLAAQGGSGKTCLLYNWALHVALGTPWSGRRCIKGKSLLISADEPLTDTAEKLSVIGYQDAGLQPGDISFWETWRFSNMQQLEDYIRKERPSLVMIDSLTACLAGMNVDLAKSSAGDAIYGLRDMANAYRCSIVILHHLNKSGGLRDSTSFVDNVSEVVKLTRAEGNFDPNEFTLEWLKSRSGLTGKHSLQRDPLNYGWRYAGPLGGSLEELDRAVNTINTRKNERFTKQQVSSLSGNWDISSTGKMLEVARRQGLITSSFQDGPNGEKPRMYHSWDYKEPALDDLPEPSAEPVEEDFF